MITAEFFLDEVCDDLQKALPDWQFDRLAQHIRAFHNGCHIANINIHLKNWTVCVMKIVPSNYQWSIGTVSRVMIDEYFMVEKIQDALSWLLNEKS